jgi:energy-coupling factor transporter ATP-binding protein EcfA2
MATPCVPTRNLHQSTVFLPTVFAAGAAAAAAADGAAVPTPVLSNVTATVRKGQRVLVLGPNGAGKSTLLKALAGRIQPWAGSVQQGEGVKLGKLGCVCVKGGGKGGSFQLLPLCVAVTHRYCWTRPPFTMSLCSSLTHHAAAVVAVPSCV